MAFQDVVNKAVEAIKDLSELEVLTFRGELTSIIDQTGKIDWSKLTANANNQGKLKLALATNVKIDADVQQFVSDDVPPQWIVDAHIAAVKSGLEARKALLELGLGLIKK